MASDTASDVVPAEIRDALFRVAADQGYRQPQFHVTAGSEERDGFMSRVHRVIIKDKDASGTKDEASVIFKVSMAYSENIMSVVFKAEGLMYSKIFPAMQKVANLREPLPWPRCHYVSVEGSPPHSLALGDFRPEGFGPADRSRGLDEDHCRLALRQLARMHGAGMALLHRDPDMGEGVNGTEIWTMPECRKIMHTFFNHIKDLPALVTDRFAVGSEVHSVLTRLCGAFASGDHYAAMLVPDGGPKGRCFVGGDCHINNMAFKYDKVTGAVQDCKVFDFQAACVSCPPVDLTRLLMTSTDKEMRDKHWWSLQRGYLKDLHDILRAAGISDPESLYPWDVFQTQMRRCAPGPMLMQPMFFNVFGMTDDEGILDIKDNIAKVDKDESTPMTLTVTPHLKSRFVDLVQDMVGWGWMPTMAEVDEWLA